MKRKLILFDIDGTLLDTAGAGLSALEEGFFAAFPQCADQEFPPLDLGGATDSGVASFLFDHFGLEQGNEQRDCFFEAYEMCLEKNFLSHGGDLPGTVLEGVPELLKALEKAGRFELGLLTGNTRNGAFLKLRFYGIERYFSHGAFGSDHFDRNRLGPVALQRANESGLDDFSPSDTLVIGDTSKDIACARAFGAKVIAVATGTVDEPDLVAANPDHCLPSLADLAATMEVIESLLD